MTPVEWSKVKDRVTALWGTNSKWAKATELTHDVHNISYATAIRSVEDRIGERMPPSPADIIAASRAATSPEPVRTRPGHEDCKHPAYAIVEYLEDGRRRGVCRVCGLEQVFPVGGLLMDWEVEDRRLASQTQDVY